VSGEASLPATLAELRAGIAMTRSAAYFQTGSEGPTADSTQRVQFDALRREGHTALLGPRAYDGLIEGAERARASLAGLLNVSPDEVAWLSNTSNAVRFAVSSLPWGPGDGIALSNVEHISTRILVRGVEQVTSRPATVIDTGPGEDYRPERFLEALDERLTPDHRLFIMSQVSCLDGRRVPVDEATRLAHARGVKVLVDGAQAVGQVPVDVAAIDAEFYAGSLHKWLLGPAGLGYLVVDRRQLPEYHPLLVPHPYFGGDGEPDGRPLSAARQTEAGTESLSARWAAGAAVEAIRRIGVDAIGRHVAPLVARLLDGLAGISAVQVISPRSWEVASGIVAVRLPGTTADQVRDLVERIWQEYKVVVKFQVDYAGIRISVAAFNTEAEIELLLAALDRVLNSIAS
jgi:cysteine desulfurase / selenocysteine lyase